MLWWIVMVSLVRQDHERTQVLPVVMSFIARDEDQARGRAAGAAMNTYPGYRIDSIKCLQPYNADDLRQIANNLEA